MGASSSDGRYVAFYTDSTNLIPGSSLFDILLRDRLTAQTVLVSSDANGVPGNSTSQQAAVSGDGRYVAFSSFASNLVPGDTNQRPDVFLKDLQTGSIERVSVASDGSQGNDGSFAPAISADGRYVAFVSMASNFYSGDSPESWDIFVHDRQTGQTVHVGSGGNFDEGPSISGDGRYVAFASNGTIVVYDGQTGQSRIASVANDGTPGNGASDYPSISADGRYVAFSSVAMNLVSGDTNGVRDVFVRDLLLGTTTRASIATDGTQSNGEVPDMERPGISGDGRFITFTSAASNLVQGDMNGVLDTFIHDMTTGQTRRVSLSSAGIEANGASGDNVLVSVSSNGNYVVFTSVASNLVPEDTNGFMDVFASPNPLAP
jgi:Tol biopolymer transport system component